MDRVNRTIDELKLGVTIERAKSAPKRPWTWFRLQ